MQKEQSWFGLQETASGSAAAAAAVAGSVRAPAGTPNFKACTVYVVSRKNVNFRFSSLQKKIIFLLTERTYIFICIRAK